jgi:hypothetical protein
MSEGETACPKNLRVTVALVGLSRTLASACVVAMGHVWPFQNRKPNRLHAMLKGYILHPYIHCATVPHVDHLSTQLVPCTCEIGRMDLPFHDRLSTVPPAGGTTRPFPSLRERLLPRPTPQDSRKTKKDRSAWHLGSQRRPAKRRTAPFLAEELKRVKKTNKGRPGRWGH